MTFEDNRFHAIFKHSYVGIIISNHHGEIEEINPFGANIFGYSEEELLGQSIEVLIPHNLRKGYIERRANYINQNELRSMGVALDLIAINKCGREFSVEVSHSSYDQDGSQKIVSFVNDITGRNKIEELLKEFDSDLDSKVESRTQLFSKALVELGHSNKNLKKSEAMGRKALEKERELNEMKSRFVSMASHEFRTPLAGILISITLIEKYNSLNLSHKLEKHIKTIQHSVKNLTSILNDFLSIDKLEQGVIETNPIHFNIKELAQSIVEDIMDLSQGAQSVSYEHKGADEYLYQDKNMLRNILINLLSNATKYSRNNKEIFIETQIDNEKLKIIVRDQGIGIPKVDQKYLFQRFFRAKNASNIEGTGLGLNIVKKYLDLMGGSITYNSQENKGTTFTIEMLKEIIK